MEFNFKELSTDTQVALMLVAAKKLILPLQNEKMRKAVGLCCEWLKNKSVSAMELYLLCDVEAEDNVVDVDLELNGEHEIYAWDAAIYAILFTTATAFYHEGETALAQDLDLFQLTGRDDYCWYEGDSWFEGSFKRNCREIGFPIAELEEIAQKSDGLSVLMEMLEDSESK